MDGQPGADPLRRFGICRYPDPYPAREVAAFNAVLDPLLGDRAGERRAYVRVNELRALGLFQRLLSPSMRDILFSIMPDPVLYHCHVYEIAADDPRPHIFPGRMSGWHRDPDSRWMAGDITHVSLFVYLSDVGTDDGAFEFAPATRAGWLTEGRPTITVTGPAGHTFAWQRFFHHRASPNRGPRRRRLFKLSIQRNRYPSRHLADPGFREVAAGILAGDTALDILLGRFQGRNPPAVAVARRPVPVEIPATGRLDIPNGRLLTGQLRARARELEARLRSGRAAPATYD